tara:strand:- start:2549 stop:4048 length:1500 start_codon:yes stop_codon:yes gene_type:complete
MTEINRYHSRPLDVHRWSNHPEATKLREAVWKDYFKDAFPPIEGKGNKAKSEPKKQFKVLLLDLYVAWLDDPELSIGVGMSRSAYKENTRYNALFISAKIMDIINHAYLMGLIDKKTGSQQSAKVTRIRASDKLAAIFNETDLTLFELTEEQPNQEVIILSKHDYINDKKKRIQVDYEDTDFEPIVEMRQQVQQYNALLWRTFIDIPTREEPVIEQPYWDKKAGKEKIRRVKLTQDNKFVRRVFYRADWNLGGRFHGGWWQSIKEDWRKQIYINDETTIEVDYSGLHVNLLYGLQGIQPPLEDHYALEHLLLDFTAGEQRKVVKGIVLNAINAATVKKAFQAYQVDQPSKSKERKLKHKQLHLLLDAFKEKHPTLGDSLGTDKGVELMNVDGRITTKIINHFTKKNIPVLTIHDSYVIPDIHSGELRTIMNKAVTEELNGFKINLDQEGIGRDQIQAFMNMDRANTLDYNHNQRVTYNRTEGYNNRLKQHNKWLLKVNN